MWISVFNILLTIMDAHHFVVYAIRMAGIWFALDQFGHGLPMIRFESTHEPASAKTEWM